jgi:hypothetical protein
MKRTNTTIFKSVPVVAVAMAIAAGPAFGSTGYPSPTPNVWGGSEQAQASGHSSLNASLNQPSPVVKGSVHSSLNASLNQPSPVGAGSGHSSVLASVNEPAAITPVHAGSSVASIVGTQGSAPVETKTIVRDSSGFDWTDAFVGAAGAILLALLSVATVHTLRRRGRVTLGSQV